VVERLAFAVLLIGGLGMLISMFLGVADVVGTQILNVPVPGPRELTESTMVVIVFGALTYAQIRRAHIRVELIYLRTPPRMQAALDVLADLCGIVFFGLLLWQAINEAIYSWQIDEATVGLIRFPLYPARFVLAAGTALLVAQLVLDMFVDVPRIVTGAPPPTGEHTLPGLLDEPPGVPHDESRNGPRGGPGGVA
jgi:TRAP-type C4-dicarboxylate transport system permease small subunit